MMRNGVFNEINSCISTGKEANVYYGASDIWGEVAIKIYKTSIMVFKDRDRYVSGEFRFRGGYCKSNPRKLIKVWAEKEMRNLKRLNSAGIPSPMPIILKNNVLVMKFLGGDGWAAQRLKDAQLSADRFSDLYQQCITHMRTMYQVCHLVHADLSEYNMLYYDKTLYIIDVSQSVEHEHPYATEFLRMDCRNINRFFAGKGVLTLSNRELYTYITLDARIQSPDEYLDQALEAAKAREERGGLTIDEEVDELVFEQAHIPKSLQELEDPERDLERAQLNYQGVVYDAIRSMAIHDMPGSKPKKPTKISDYGPANRPGADADDEDDSAGESKSDDVLNAASHGFVPLTLELLRKNNPEFDHLSDDEDEDDTDDEDEDAEEGGEEQLKSRTSKKSVKFQKRDKSAGDHEDDDEEDGSEDDEDDGDDEDEDEDEEGDGIELTEEDILRELAELQITDGKAPSKTKLTREEMRAQRKAHKAMVKQENRIKRANKMKKKEKQKRIKKTKRR